MRLPTFIMFGMAKTGSTSLHRYLSQHPQVYVSPVKEPNYFLPDDAGELRSSVRSWKEYVALFDGAGDKPAVGEFSIRYHRGGAFTADRIRAAIPEVKLFAIIRQPVERIYSRYLNHRRFASEPHETLAEALRAEDVVVASGGAPKWSYRASGYYYGNLKAFYDRFAHSRIRIFLYEDWSNPRALLSELLTFLEISPHFEADLTVKENVRGVPTHPRLHRLARTVAKACVKPMPRGMASHVGSWLYRLQESDLKEPPNIDPALARELTACYREDILKTQDLIGRDLSHWLK